MRDTNALGYIKEKTIKIKLLDGEHELKFDLNALELLEEEFGGIDVLDNLDLSKMRNFKAFIRAGIAHEYEDDKIPTPRAVGKLIDLNMLMQFEKSISEALIKLILNNYIIYGP
jgi:hypothetical protein